MNRYRRPPALIADDFFAYLGRHLPQQCASDEFYFLPRAETAIGHLDRLDDLAPETVKEHIEYVKKLLGELPSEAQDDLQEEIDRQLLRQSMESFLIEFRDDKVHHEDPILYLKVFLFATDQAVSRTDTQSRHVKARLAAIFEQIPSFLSGAIRNLRRASQISLQVAARMAEDALLFYTRDVRSFIGRRLGEDKRLLSRVSAVADALEKYKKNLREVPSKDSFAVGPERLDKIVAVRLGHSRPPAEILEIAHNAYQETQDKIRAFARQIDRRKNGKPIIYEELPPEQLPTDRIHLYEREVNGLRKFFYTQDILTFPAGEKVIVRRTPLYLRSLRATAAYKAPLTGDVKGPGIFYVTPGEVNSEEISESCPYLSAHETYPGHHVLDHLRIHHSNPIRRQIESPLFYEGWACYAEELLDEFGYVQEPEQRMIQLKRQLWRMLRAMLDVELQTGTITLAQAAGKIERLGYSKEDAARQVRRFCLTPGYQLCYFMGHHEITRLRKKFGSLLGLKHFHDALLDGGQLPFHLVQKRLKARIGQKTCRHFLTGRSKPIE